MEHRYVLKRLLLRSPSWYSTQIHMAWVIDNGLHHQTVIVPTNCEIHGYTMFEYSHKLYMMTSLIFVVDISLHVEFNMKNKQHHIHFLYFF